MPRHTIDFDTVRRLAREIGEVVGPADGAPALRFRGKLLAWTPSHKSVEPDSLAVRMDVDRRAELIEGAPDVYYVTDHYLHYPTILVRLARIQPDALKDLLRMACSFVGGKSPARKRASR